MSSKSALAVVVAALTTVFLAFLKQTYWAVLVDLAFGHIAKMFGVERATMIALAAPYIVAFAAALVIVIVAYQIGLRDRSLKPAFEIIFDPNDKAFMSSSNERTRYFIGLKILTSHTIDSPNIWALNSPFTDRVFKQIYDNNHPSGNVRIYNGGALDPKVTEIIELFSLRSREYLDMEDKTNPLAIIQQFTLEARGRDVPPVKQKFEYDPNKFPMIRKLP